MNIDYTYWSNYDSDGRSKEKRATANAITKDGKAITFRRVIGN